MLDVTKLKEKLSKVITNTWKDKLEPKLGFLKSYLIIAFKYISQGVFVFCITYLLCNGIYHLIKKKPATYYTKYSAMVMNEIVECNIAQKEKGCYNLLNCEDGNSYFCVQGIKMAVDK